MKTSALVKEPTKAKGKTKAKAAAEEKPHYDIPHGVTIQDICNTYRINMESIAAATNYPIAYIKTLADDPTSSMVPGFQSKLRSAFPIAFDDVDYDDPFGDMLLGGRKSAEEIFYDMTGRTLLQRSLLYQVEYQLPYISASTIVTISTMLEKISTRKTYESAENFVFSFLSQMGIEDRRFSIWDKGPTAMRVQAGGLAVCSSKMRNRMGAISTLIPSSASQSTFSARIKHWPTLLLPQCISVAPHL